MAIAHKTGVECIGKIRNYLVFYNESFDRYGVMRDDEHDESGLIRPPHCAYCLDAILHAKDIPAHEIAEFKRRAGLS